MNWLIVFEIAFGAVIGVGLGTFIFLMYAHKDMHRIYFEFILRCADCGKILVKTDTALIHKPFSQLEDGYYVCDDCIQERITTSHDCSLMESET